MDKFGDFMVYVDESGDHSVAANNPEYPVFVLAFCIFRITGYISTTVPAMQSLKFKYFGHDMVVLHERDIRKKLSPFSLLGNEDTRTAFMADLNGLIIAADFTIVASVIQKDRFKSNLIAPQNPYHVALEHGLERVFAHLRDNGQKGLKTSVVFESRGKKEDKELHTEFRRILDRTRLFGLNENVEFVCVSKQANSSGLQIADLVARPIGIHILNPEQPNRAWDALRSKIRASPQGRILGWGMKVTP